MHNSRGRLTIEIEHVGGIGKTELVLKTGEWPARIHLLFRNFKALEGLKIYTAERKFESSVSTADKNQVIDLGDQFTAKRKGRSILIEAPANFVKETDKSLRIEWVDFYRN